MTCIDIDQFPGVGVKDAKENGAEHARFAVGINHIIVGEDMAFFKRISGDIAPVYSTFVKKSIFETALIKLRNKVINKAAPRPLSQTSAITSPTNPWVNSNAS